MNIARFNNPARFNKDTNSEKLNLWDRLFNRYKTIIESRGEETWSKRYPNNQFYMVSGLVGKEIPNSDFKRQYVIYKKIDRLTGSETLEKTYLN